MNKHLKRLIQIVQQDENLTTDQRNISIKSLKDADKEIETIATKLANAEKEKLTTDVLLKETIAELEQKRNIVEAQNRELEIEASLERLRVRAIAMRTSTELNEVIALFYDEMKKVEPELDRCFIMTFDPEACDSVWWMASGDSLNYSSGLKVQYHEHAPYLAFVNGWREENDKWRYTLEGTEKKDWDSFIFQQTELQLLPEPVKQFMTQAPRAYWSCSFQKFGCVSSGSHTPLNDSAFDFAHSFCQSLPADLHPFPRSSKSRSASQRSRNSIGIGKSTCPDYGHAQK
ncbi:MAG: hypothetical protein U5K79_01670 [Cyclobacteriaceae bacterium]|nr:hypothetical protein [Cyclobacteriaceae bacterium]